MPHSIHTRSIAERMRWLAELGAEHSRIFASPEAYLERRRYQAGHPTAILAFKCMDGRMHLPYITKTPLGIIEPFRNLGGAFDIGWPHLGELVTHEVLRAVESGRRVLILVTYHFSRGERSRGCSGFDFDLEAARSSAFAFRRQLESVFGSDHQTVYPLVAGVETDEDALTLHGERGAVIELAALAGAEQGEGGLEDRLTHALRSTFRDMPGEILRDLLPLVVGNLRHIAEVRRTERALDIDHHEWILCVGRGFDFLHVPNTALIVGPYSPNIDVPIVNAARIIQSNMEAGRIPDDGMILLASSPYEEIGTDYRRAVEKSKFLSRFAAATIQTEVPYVHRRMIRKTCVLNWTDRSLEEIETVYP
ncbi:MAG TPA: hypothetical protein VI078_08755 [bacterium]